MTDFRVWLYGALFVSVMLFFGEFFIAFRSYFSEKAGVDSDLFLSAIWVLVGVGAFFVTFFSVKASFIKGISLIFVVVLVGPLLHFLSGFLGARIDYAGFPGLRVSFQLYLFFGLFSIGIGSVLAVLISKNDS